MATYQSTKKFYNLAGYTEETKEKLLGSFPIFIGGSLIEQDCLLEETYHSFNGVEDSVDVSILGTTEEAFIERCKELGIVARKTTKL